MKWLVLVLAACSGGKAKVVEDARKPAPAPVIADAAVAQPLPPVPTGPYRVDTAAKTGDVQIRVEWKDVPQALRASPGLDECGGQVLPPLAPTTTWGIPEAFVAIDVDHGKALTPQRPRIVLEGCALSPRLAVAGTSLAIASATEQPAQVTFEGKPVYLPIAGHEVEATLTPGTTYTVGYGTRELATVVSATTPYTAITEATGQVIVRDVPVGTHRVRAWLPKRGALEPRTVAGSVTVTAGALTEVTLDISRP